MKYLSKKVKLGTLKTYYNCLIYNPLHYDDSKKINIYYNILKEATEEGSKTWCGVINNECVLMIDNKKVER